MKIKNLKVDQYFRINESTYCLIASNDKNVIAKNIITNEFEIFDIEKEIAICTSKYLIIGYGDVMPFDKPTYTKFNGRYGYLTVTDNTVYFITTIDEQMYCDELEQYTTIKIN